MLKTPFRVPLAREYLRQRLVMNAGINPMSGYPLGDTSSDYIDDTAEERAGRMEYMRDLNQSVSHIAGLIEGCLIRVWRDRNGGFELAPPVSTAQAFYERNGEMDDLYFEQSEWDALFEQRYPETDLARMGLPDDDATDEQTAEVDPADFVTSPRIGRPLGSGGLKDEDEKLYDDIRIVLAEHPLKSVTSIAWTMVSRIPGDGADENRVKRLVRGFKKGDRKGSE